MLKQIFELQPLFHDVQMQRVFEDGKTFVDCIPKQELSLVEAAYQEAKNAPGFDLKTFVLLYFELPKAFAAPVPSAEKLPVDQHIQQLWTSLTRQPDEAAGSLLPLPHPYIVPGGRFGEVYYWDSYFTMLGLKESGLYDLIENMVDNFTHLIETVGYIPNGNRSYYLGRSQPPFYALMVNLLATIQGEQTIVRYLPALEKEYQFWMKGAASIDEATNASLQVVRMKDGERLNRYWDEYDTARPESYREDVELTHASDQTPAVLYRNLRAGAASGWDYSSRWFKDGRSFSSIDATNVVPVDLNALLFELEQTIANAHRLAGDEVKSAQYLQLAESRKQAIQKYCWNEALGFYTDVAFDNGQPIALLSLAGMVPLFVNIATSAQAQSAASIIESKFLQAGGLTTTLHVTGQQWDAPNGWAPLQWMSIIGLEQYGYSALASVIAQRWIQLNSDVYQRTGKLMEKYNVVDTHLEAGGGEYAGQDGFGWTNGVLLALMRQYPSK